MFDLSLGIMAYNEEANIGRLVRSVLGDQFSRGRLKEIIVVASGCTDRTADIVRTFAQEDPRINLLVQLRREGKASAINLFLAQASGDILILESADTLPEKGTLDRLVAPFTDPRVGMTGSRPIPRNSKDNFIGFAVHLMWDLHHEISLETPKLGELVAFRDFVKEIPNDTAVDEAAIEAIVRQCGYELRYVPDAVVMNKGPESLSDFLKQRRRIAAGHMDLLSRQEYKVSTTDPWRILRILSRQHTRSLRDSLWTLGTIGLEVIGRLLGCYDFHVKKKNPYIWDIAASTKKWT